ncbi:MAG: DUF739 family protein [Fibrobacter sp.]|nr:DUF739 family protein [Fibrobacter sp.]
MKYDSNKLRGRIVEMYGTLAKFADAMEVSRPTITRRLAKGDWRQPEIVAASNLLGIKPAELYLYFFNFGVERN